MSHFAVAVISKSLDEVEKLLAPYDENIEVSKYIKYTKSQLIEKARADFKEYITSGCYAEYIKNPDKYKESCRNEGHIKYLEEEIPLKMNWTDEQFYQDEIRYYEEEDIGKNGEVYSTYNPKSKWDWYEIGGRFSGTIKIKNGEFVDSAKISNCDFSINTTEYNAAKRFWGVVVEGNEILDCENKEDFFTLYSKEYYTDRYKTKDNYAKIRASFHTYALIDVVGDWHEQGKMGWFGFDSATSDTISDYIEYFNKYLESIPKNYYITIVDCHI